jgi:hypothetical protein
MTPRAIRQELRAVRTQLQRAGRVSTDYRRYIGLAILRLDRLAEAVNLDRPKPGPKAGGAP